jgi:hypothetical protein
MGTLVEHQKKQLTFGGPLMEYVDYVASGGPLKLMGNATVTWEWKKMALGWSARYYHSYKVYGSPGDPYYQTPTTVPLVLYTNAQGSYRIPPQVYNDMFARYSFGENTGHLGKWSHNLTIQFGVKNVLNHVPPFDAYYGPYYFSPFGDARLRGYWISITKGF